jgi:hypothetical protein
MDIDLRPQAQEYANNNGFRISGQPVFGHGTDGSVWESSRNTAVKAFYIRKNYENEYECYRRLGAAGVTQIAGLAVPIMLGFDRAIMVIEMTIVQPPYLLDFGKVYLDNDIPPYFDDPVRMADWHADVQELFEDRASEVYAVLARLKDYGITYVDPKPANIRFE